MIKEFIGEILATDSHGLTQTNAEQKLKVNNMVNNMREEYDFSQGERGKFYNKDAKLQLPVYLDDEIMTYMEGVARKRNTDISTIVNQLLRSDIQLLEVIQ